MYLKARDRGLESVRAAILNIRLRLAGHTNDSYLITEVSGRLAEMKTKLAVWRTALGARSRACRFKDCFPCAVRRP
jgi:hypothetical protein